MTNAELARRLGLHPSSVSRWDDVPGYAKEYVRVLDLAAQILGVEKVRATLKANDKEQA